MTAIPPPWQAAMAVVSAGRLDSVRRQRQLSRLQSFRVRSADPVTSASCPSPSRARARAVTLRGGSSRTWLSHNEHGGRSA